MNRVIAVMGSNGFTGQFLSAYFKRAGETTLLLHKPVFDITNSSTWFVIKSGVRYIFFDAITVNKGNRHDIQAVNVEGLQHFIQWLNETGIDYHYVYFSTLSTLKIEQFPDNDYIQSKFRAEQLIRSGCRQYTIIRLTFPFGKNENANRLLSRIIGKLKKGEPVVVDDVTLNMTPVEGLKYLLEKEKFTVSSEINFTDGKAHRLQEIVAHIAEQLGAAHLVTCKEGQSDISYDNSYFTNGYTFDIYSAVKKMLV